MKKNAALREFKKLKGQIANKSNRRNSTSLKDRSISRARNFY